MNSLKSIVAHIPHAPGVYRFLDAKKEVLYVGKAIDLKNRVSSYFRALKDMNTRLRKLMEKTVDLEYTVVGSELEALILETNLIKAFRPRYNILMKDDKNYVYLKITMKADYPQLIITRTLENDGAKYFGPKSSASELRRILDTLKKIFLYRHCSYFIQLNDKGISSEAARRDHMNRCFGVCVLKANPSEYRRVIEQVIHFFEGKTDAIERSLKEEMAEAAAFKQFERAAMLRDRLLAIQALLDVQRVSAPDHASRDVVGLALEGGAAYVTLLAFRDGKLVHHDNFILNAVDVDSGAELEDEEVLAAFLEQYYEKAADFPKEVVMPKAIPDARLLEDWISTMADVSLLFTIAKRGKLRALLNLACENAKSFARQQQVRWQAGAGQNVEQALHDLKTLLALKKVPNRIECYDISHLGGVDTVGSMVVFEKGFPKKADYRHFKLRSVQEKIDDYQAMGEVLMRRFRYLQAQPTYLVKPKKKQLPAIQAILEGEGLDDKDLDQHKMLIVEKGKTIIAIGRLKPLDKDVSELASIWVDAHYRSKGLGQEIVYWLLKKQKKGKVYTLPLSIELMDFYGALGFFEVKGVAYEALCKKQGLPFMVYHLSKETKDASFSKKPDLLIVDGGKGQLSIAMKAMKEAKLSIPLIALAKREEEIFVPGKSQSLRLPHEAGALQLIQRLRDEAHRFALKFQRNLREKRLLN